jgi:ankyrin repeat protein
VINAILAAGVEATARDIHGGTALMHAAANGNIDVTKLLVENGADLEAESEDGHTALMYAMEEGHTEIAELLEEAGARR